MKRVKSCGLGFKILDKTNLKINCTPPAPPHYPHNYLNLPLAPEESEGLHYLCK